MQGSSERGETAAQGQACLARFPGQPESARLLVQIADRVSQIKATLERAAVRCAAKHGVNQHPLRERIFEIALKRCGAGWNGAFDIFIEYERFESERVRHRPDGQGAVGKLKELQDGKTGRSGQ